MHIAIVTSSLMVLSTIKSEVMLTCWELVFKTVLVGEYDFRGSNELTNESGGLAGVVGFMFMIIYALNVVGVYARYT